MCQIHVLLVTYLISQGPGDTKFNLDDFNTKTFNEGTIYRRLDKLGELIMGAEVLRHQR